MRPRVAAFGLFVATLFMAVGCRTWSVTPATLVSALKAAAPSAYVQGAPVGFGPPTVLNAEDFVYDARLSPNAQSFAFARLGVKGYFLSLFDLTRSPPARRADTFINAYETDVEMTDFSPDGRRVATVSRDGAVRVFDAASGLAVAAWLTEEPLVSLAFHPDGRTLAVGSANGLLTVLSLEPLGYLAEARGHTDEVRGLAFANDGRLFSAGWDKRVVTWSLGASTEPESTGRTHVEQRSGVPAFRIVVDSLVSATATFDARLPLTVVQSALAQSAGIDVAALTETTTVVTAFGNQVAKVARGRRVGFKGLVFDRVDVAVCDSCVATGVQAVIGQALLDRLTYATDGANHELVVTAKPGEALAAGPRVDLRQTAHFTLDGFVNDLSLDARGQTLGLALSAVRAVRTREVYEREKRGELEPPNPLNVGARVDAATGQVLSRAAGHSGVVATAGISPDGQSLVTGGWDKHVLLHSVGQATPLADEAFGWAVRRTRFSRDGRWASVAAWTPQNPLGDHQSKPSAVVYEVVYGPDGEVKTVDAR